MKRRRESPRKKERAAPAARRRMTAEEARAAILDAAEALLRSEGPEGLRLQQIAADVGVSHPAVLHHFGSREGLVQALVARSMTALEDELVACFADAKGPDDLKGTIARVDEVMRVKGQARLLAWLALMLPPDAQKPESRLRELTELFHAARVHLTGREHDFNDTAYGVVLGSVAVFGAALIGPSLLRLIGLPDDERELVRFREWVADLLARHAGIDPPESAAPPAPRGAKGKRQT